MAHPHAPPPLQIPTTSWTPLSQSSPVATAATLFSRVQHNTGAPCGRTALAPAPIAQQVSHPAVYIDPGILNDRMSTIDLSGVTGPSGPTGTGVSVPSTSPSAPFDSVLSRWQKLTIEQGQTQNGRWEMSTLKDRDLERLDMAMSDGGGHGYSERGGGDPCGRQEVGVDRLMGGKAREGTEEMDSHAASALVCAGPPMSVAVARLDARPPLSRLTTMPEPVPEYTLSTNPPNPKSCFRLGDWICTSAKCAAHNFGRNHTCIGCGSPRSSTLNHSPSSGPSHTQLHQQPCLAPPLPSPRFTAPTNSVTYYSSAPPQQHRVPHPSIITTANNGAYPTQQHYPLPPPSLSPSASPSLPHVSHPPKSAHPLLTPSGRAFAVGGKVQNISSDPLNPCIMYWPDNEPFPEQGQIRPSGLVGVAQPPILNTGNRGPISHQPGDWICQKCNYLNWRRRKVCQTCLPYAEGNGDSISAAVQAERIALLSSVLSNGQIGMLPGPSPAAASPTDLRLNAPPQPPRAVSLTPPQSALSQKRPFIDISSPSVSHLSPHPHAVLHHRLSNSSLQTLQHQQQAALMNKPVHRSQSHLTLGQQYAQQGYLTTTSPIYQTSGRQDVLTRQPSPLSPLYSTGPDPRGGALTASPTIRQHLQHSMPSGMVGFAPPSPIFQTSHQNNNIQAPIPAPLLPSFLQDMVQSPALSPTSTTTSSAEFSSIEEFDADVSGRGVGGAVGAAFPLPRPRGASGSSAASNSSSGSGSASASVTSSFLGVGSPPLHSGSVGVVGGGGALDATVLNIKGLNIWSMDGEETKSLSSMGSSGFPVLPPPRRDSRESLNAGVVGVNLAMTGVPLPVGAGRRRAGL